MGIRPQQKSPNNFRHRGLKKFAKMKDVIKAIDKGDPADAVDLEFQKGCKKVTVECILVYGWIKG